MKENLRKGLCPGALRPMMARDGLLVRLRITGGILSMPRARALAQLAARYGNGLFDLSARGNLQMRGVTMDALAALQDGLASQGLIDDDAASEAIRNVIASPLAGLASCFDIRSLAARLEAAIVADPGCRTLPGKFAILVDDGSQPSLTGIGADLRFDMQPFDALFSIGIGGDAVTAVRVGTCRADELVARAVELAARLATLLARHDLRRVRHLVAQLGASVLVETLRCGEPAGSIPQPSPAHARDWVGRRVTDPRMPVVGLAAPFGRLDAGMLDAAAGCAAASPYQEIRLTPWRMLLIPGCEARELPEGFIVDREDPRLAVAACVGATGCARGTTDTQADAAHLSDRLASTADEIGLHVSGCIKGCANPSRTRATIVAENGRYNIIRDGRASDRPFRTGLSLAEVTAVLKEYA